MHTHLTEQDIAAALAAQRPIEGIVADGGFYLSIREYVPYVATAVHAGHRTRAELDAYFALSADDRYKEEDPYTDAFIEAMPIRLVARDSRYEYDLNRAPDACIYDTAWGQTVWQQPLSDALKAPALAKHAQYYRVLHMLLERLETLFGACLLFDIHSYNWQIRHHHYAPVVNLGTAQVDTLRWRPIIDGFKKAISGKAVANIAVDCAENTVFQGLGYQANYIQSHFSNTLVLATELKKVFMDERSDELFPLVFEKLQRNLHIAMTKTARLFVHSYTPKRKPRKPTESRLDPNLLELDSQLYRLAKNLDTLHYVNPINIAQEKRRFFARRDYQPNFSYRPLKIDPYEFKERLYRLPVSQLSDPVVKDLYRKVIDNYATKIELITQIGREQFLYNSLRYYGEPSSTDIANATFLLHALETEPLPPKNIDAKTALLHFNAAIERLQIPCKASLSTKIVSKAMVDNSKKLLLINSSAMFSQLDIDALIEHEIGVHLLTTLNAEAQPLKVLHLGFPGNTYTQEGLAIYRELCSGNLNLTRLKVLALRVIAIDMMLKGESFAQVFQYLDAAPFITTSEAFALTTRVFRGGGFTKDFLYLRGFRDIVKLASNRRLDNLYLGKTGLALLDTLDTLVEQGVLQKPKYLPDTSQDPRVQPAVLSYLIQSIK
ncbi:flavohemoglobin expression-modulating QEGLA motif protein [Pseudoalteromonas fenneropenaei]|uniref:Flavohemoglobin expression-modulating QEGLA motif protein n=1 Tax=Pseudoalteromonas fenneropenaei TaxID=1737459 RepID=A0ABV7CLK6_9GAMM